MEMTLVLACESMAGMNYSPLKDEVWLKKRKRKMIVRVLQTIVVSRSSPRKHMIHPTLQIL